MCSEWFELVEKAKLSNEQTEQLTIAAQAQFKVINRVHTIVWNSVFDKVLWGTKWHHLSHVKLNWANISSTQCYTL